MNQIQERLRDEILLSGYVIDPEGIHHELSSGVHAKKLDFDKIPDNSQLFQLWVSSLAAKVQSCYQPEELSGAVLLSVANGTNRVVEPLSQLLNTGTVPLLTKKTSPKTVALDHSAEKYYQLHRPPLTIVIEDVGTSGGTTYSAVQSAQENGGTRIECIISWQRREELEALVARGVVYHSVIVDVLEEYSPMDCKNIGFCSAGEEVILRPKL